MLDTSLQHAELRKATERLSPETQPRCGRQEVKGARKGRKRRRAW
jgi:hypothetical protein